MPAGNYGDTQLTDEQYNNAAIIASTGYGMGASPRDVQVALMAAMTESSLRNLNYGDRDSQGLFQQRPSQGWGTVAQVTDPVHASQSFFHALFGVPDRDSLSLQMEAQDVQRSGYSDGSNYAPWVAMSDALVQALGGNPGTGTVTTSGGGPTASDSSGGVLSSIGDGISGIANALTGFAKITAWLSQESSWVRIISGVGGSILVFTGIWTIGKEVRNG